MANNFPVTGNPHSFSLSHLPLSENPDPMVMVSSVVAIVITV